MKPGNRWRSAQAMLFYSSADTNSFSLRKHCSKPAVRLNRTPGSKGSNRRLFPLTSLPLFSLAFLFVELWFKVGRAAKDLSQKIRRKSVQISECSGLSFHLFQFIIPHTSGEQTVRNKRSAQVYVNANAEAPDGMCFQEQCVRPPRRMITWQNLTVQSTLLIPRSRSLLSRSAAIRWCPQARKERPFLCSCALLDDVCQSSPPAPFLLPQQTSDRAGAAQDASLPPLGLLHPVPPPQPASGGQQGEPE